MASYHVLVEWPGDAQPWLVLIEATSSADARRAVKMSDAVRDGHGKITHVREVTRGEKRRDTSSGEAT